MSHHFTPIKMAAKQDNTVLARRWSNYDSDTLGMGKQNGTATLENSWIVSYKVRHTLSK